MGTLAQLFESGEQSSQKGHFRNLVLLARQDGVVTDTEKNLLNRIADRLSLTSEQVQEICDDPDSYPIIPPYSREERYDRFVQLVQMALIDGTMDNGEAALIRKLALALGFSGDKIEEKFRVIVDKLRNGYSREEIVESIL